jgi:exodeoxyribonuclease-5
MVGTIKTIAPLRQGSAGQPLDELLVAEIDMENGLVPYSGKILAKQFANPVSFSSETNRKSGFDLFDFGYALTVHKAQGSQAKRVLLFEERNKHMTDDDWKRWLYTGITRAEEELTIVGS